MNTPIDYHCKICRKPSVAYYDTACPIHQIESWKSALCCVRCYVFRDDYMKAKRSVQKRCIELISVRTIREDNTKRDATGKIRESLTKLTQRIATLCSDYYRVQNIWDSEMVSILMDKPSGCNKALDAFHAGFRRIGFQPKQAEMPA